MSVATKRRIDEKEAAHLTRCMNDFPYYAKHHLKIRTKQAQLVPLVLNEPQKIVHKRLAQQLRETGRIRAVILKARQFGISTLTAGRFFRSVHLWGNLRATVVAHEKGKSSEIFEFYDRMYQNLMDEIRPDKLSTQRGNILHLVNDSQIVVDTAMDEEAGRSTTIQRLHASEVARWRNAKTVFVSLMNAVPDIGSEVIVESTAKGVGNFFHELWLQAENGTNGFLAIFLPWWIFSEYELECSERDRDEILGSKDPFERLAQDTGIMWEGKLHKLSPEKLNWRRKIGIPEKCAGDIRRFREEYPATAREAFVASGDTFFDKDALEHYETEAKPPEKRASITTRKGAICHDEDPEGRLRIWELPRKDGIYVIGADTATGKQVQSMDDEWGGRDFSCADVLDARTLKQVAQLHGRVPPETFAAEVVMLGYLYNTATIAIERNFSSGETVVQKVHDELKYPNAYTSKQVNTTRDGRITSRWGWWTTAVTRPIMLDELSELIRNRTLVIPCAETIRELFTFILTQRGQKWVPMATEGTHDDRVISLAIALQIARTSSYQSSNWTPPDPDVYDGTGAFDYGWSA